MKIGSINTVLVADPLPILCDSLANALNTYSDLKVFDDRPFTGPDTVSAAVRLKPDFAVIDFWMPDMEGPAITRTILSQAPECNVILMSFLTAEGAINEALEAGAVAFLPKDALVVEVVDVIRRILGGEEAPYAGGLKDLVSERRSLGRDDLSLFATLTPRQVEILVLFNKGGSIPDIAERLRIRPKTVSNQLTEMYVKTKTNTQNELVAKARACGFLRD